MTDFKNSKNVGNYVFKKGALSYLRSLIDKRLSTNNDIIVYIIDHYFKNQLQVMEFVPIKNNDFLYFLNTENEITTNLIDDLKKKILEVCISGKNISAVVGIGGGSSLDTAKAISNLLTNEGKAEDYQGWGLVKKPGIYKIGIPTLSGTGAEASSTCVMLNERKNLKLGMNSEFTIYDQLILDPNLTKSVPRNQYFVTGLDTYIHCFESLNGKHRHSLADAYSKVALDLIEDIFIKSGSDMMSDENREKLMIASYMGGCSIANSFVGVVHPFSAGLSVVLKTHHCLANCIVMQVMDEFYPKECEVFRVMLDKNDITLPSGICKNLSNEEYEKLYQSTIIHKVPLENALGENYLKILTKEKVIELFKKL